MALQTPVDREFAVLARGYIRDRVVLANFREGLRAATNPETGLPFTEDEIQRATQPKTRWYNEAQAIDDYGQSEQRRALYLADQLRIERASTKWLVEFHGAMWDQQLLDPTGGSGKVTVTGMPGILVVGSTTPGDPTAHKARDAAGNQYQVLIGGAISGAGSVQVSMFALGTGSATNVPAGTVLIWIFRDPNMTALAAVAADFTGGTDRETDAEFAARLFARIRHAQGAGNDSQTRGWTRKASNAIEDAFVYPCAFHAGSVLIAITQKRGAATGPLARLPSPGTLAAAIAYMTPPGSAVYPTPPYVLVTSVQSQPTNLVVQMAMAKGSTAGWRDVLPFPSYSATTPHITIVFSQTVIQIQCLGDPTLPAQLPGATLTGASCPSVMVWNAAASRFETLHVSLIQDIGSSLYNLVLSSPPSFMLAPNQIVAPDVPLRLQIATAIESYMDELGPRELFDLSIDPRGARCVRFPATSEESPFRVGSLVATSIIEALGGTSVDAQATFDKTQPDYPTDLTQGPNMLTLGTVGLYPI